MNYKYFPNNKFHHIEDLRTISRKEFTIICQTKDIHRAGFLLGTEPFTKKIHPLPPAYISTTEVSKILKSKLLQTS